MAIHTLEEAIAHDFWIACVARDEYQLNRVLIVDWDVHHGNGTQDAFYADGRVGFFSSHRWPFYPGTGGSDETGTGDGLGATRNLVTPPSSSPMRRGPVVKSSATHVPPAIRCAAPRPRGCSARI